MRPRLIDTCCVKRRFVILTTGRSGSELLVSLLDSHPDIVCEGELLARSRVWPSVYVLARAAAARRQRAKAYGWKLLLSQFQHPGLKLHGIDEPHTYRVRLHEMGFKLLLLTRDDPVRQALSFFHGSQRAFHYRKGDQNGFVPLKVDPVQLLAGTWIVESETRQLREMVRSVPHLFLSYERDLLDQARHEATLTQVCEYIGIEPAPVRTDLVKLAPTTIGETLTNFDEVAALLRQTRYSEYLENG